MSIKNKELKKFGQYFTPKKIVKEMMKLSRNFDCTKDGYTVSDEIDVLEPSCGEGIFIKEIVNKINEISENTDKKYYKNNKKYNITGIEVDDNLKQNLSNNVNNSDVTVSILHQNFLSYSINKKYDLIIGNPPYIKYSAISQKTKEILDSPIFCCEDDGNPFVISDILNQQSNLYLYFILKCFAQLKDKGELIFIVPREFLNATSAEKMNKILYENGTITDILDFGDSYVFKNASPNCIVFRYVKGDYSKQTIYRKSRFNREKGTLVDKTYEDKMDKNKETRLNDLPYRKFYLNEGQLLFLKLSNYDIEDINTQKKLKFSDLFFVKVGAVSGADKYFENPKGNIDIVYSKTCKTGQTKRMIYNEENEELIKYKNILINRKIKKFNEETWYMWGRDFYHSDKERIYVNAKTRNKEPFFYNKCKNYDGSILAIFPKFNCDKETCLKICKKLNDVDWDELGFVCDGRFQFSQRALENTLLPWNFHIFSDSTNAINI